MNERRKSYKLDISLAEANGEVVTLRKRADELSSENNNLLDALMDMQFDRQMTCATNERLGKEVEQDRRHLDSMQQILSEMTEEKVQLEVRLANRAVTEQEALTGVMTLCSQLIGHVDALILTDNLFSISPSQLHAIDAQVQSMMFTLDALPRPDQPCPLYDLMFQLHSALLLQRHQISSWLDQIPVTEDSKQAGTLMNAVVEYQARLFLTSQGRTSTASDWEPNVEQIMMELSVYQQYKAWVQILFAPFNISTPRVLSEDDSTTVEQFRRAGFNLLHPDKLSKLRKMSVVWARMSDVGFRVLTQIKADVHESRACQYQGSATPAAACSSEEDVQM